MRGIELGVYLANLRIKNGFKSQRSLAFEANISPATLSRIESGIQHPTPGTLYQIATCLKGVEYKELLMAADYLEGKENIKTENEHESYLVFNNNIIRLSYDEAEHIHDSLEMYRLLKKKKKSEDL